MGLDMFLTGRIYFSGHPGEPGPFDGQSAPTLEGRSVQQTIVRLGYWRKHPNLHGFIVQRFAGGKDECQEIELTEANLVETLKAVEEDRLPETRGFFFGVSQPEDKPDSVRILNEALQWLHNPTPVGVYRTVLYQASW